MLVQVLGLYRIYFFQSGRSRILPDLEWQIRPEPELEPDFQIDCNFTNLMCKNITNVRVIFVFDYFCAAVTATSFTCTHAVIYATAM